MNEKRLWIGVLAFLFLITLTVLFSVPQPQTAIAQVGTPTPDQFASKIFMWDGGNLMVVASGGEIEVQSGGVLDIDGTANLTNVDASGYVKAGVATPVAITTPEAGDVIASDDLEVIDDTTLGDNVEINGDITLENDEKIINSTDAQISFTDGTNILMTIVDAGTTGNVNVTGAVDVQGGVLTLQNDEAISNATNGRVKITDGTNTLVEVIDQGTTGDLNVTAALTVTGLADLNGGIAVDTTNFTVDGSTGAVLAAGLASLNGGIAVDTSNFTVSGANGNVVTAGSLDVQGGTITLQSDEVINNSTDGRVKITDGTNTLIEVIDQGTSGDLSVTNALTVTGLSDLDGGIAVDGTNFTVNGTTGAVSAAGSAALDGGITVDTSNFTVDGTSGAVSTASTLGATGLANLNGGIAVDTSNFTVDGTSGAVSTASTLGVTGLSTLSGGESIPLNIENMRQPSVLTVAITYTAAAGGTGVVATIGAGEIWIVHDVLVQITESFVADTGNDATLTIGDGNVAAGFFTATNDANLISTYSEGTGYATGWVGMGPDEKGAYLDANGYGFVYNPAAEETIDWAVDETDGETLSAGAATIYVFYTRVQ